MRNRDVLHNMCLYDLLCRMNYHSDVCVLRIIEGRMEISCRADNCKDCIAAWLNEEAEKDE